MHLTLFTDTNTDKSAKIVLNRTIKAMDANILSHTIEAYNKGGHKVCLEIQTESSSYNKSIKQCIELAQRIGRSYILNGSIDQELDLWSNDSSVSGLTSIHFQLFSRDFV